ncbi:hypothetical protein BU16DRAFT_122420 [Lophium mytilinum]|uniref:XRCC4 coiled-coil domain-containing protein n=1 Tax=Lophium mytilinum TaxID=390894 RepID=A0A6A6QGN7_9PEZI|nr:hypothetical protein BU16DRAFT_122420 [Lophium mytilinum]
MAAGDRHIIEIPAAAGEGDEFIIVDVTSHGPGRLDVTLLGSEGQFPYFKQIQQRKLKELRTTRKGSDEQWEAALSHLLLNEAVKAEYVSALKGVQVVYQEDGDNLKLIVRQEVATTKLKHNMGEIVLLRDEEKEIDPLDWARVAARGAAAAKDQFADLQTQLGTQQSTIDKLHAQLDDLVKAKEENDNAMLQKFTELLNEKKMKIRDQQRLLAGAKVDPKAAVTVEATREDSKSKSKSRKPAPSRTSKRKANGTARVVESESEGEFEQMQVDETEVKAEQEREEDMPEATTPDRSDDETEDEEGDVGEASTSTQPSKPVELATRTASKPEQTPELPPPRRELPFAKAKTRGQKVAPPPVEDEDDDTEDDEL